MRPGLIVVFLAVTGIATAQPGPQPGMGRDTVIIPMLLMSRQVRDELQLTVDQGKKIDAELSVLNRPINVSRPADRDAAALEKYSKALSDARRKQLESYDRLVALLNAKQRARLREISLQRHGLALALRIPPVQKELALTVQQKKQIESMHRQADDKYMKEAQELMKRQQTDPNHVRARFEKLQKSRESLDAAMLKLLSPSQKAKWTKMQGKKLDLNLKPSGVSGAVVPRRGGGG